MTSAGLRAGRGGADPISENSLFRL